MQQCALCAHLATDELEATLEGVGDPDGTAWDLKLNASSTEWEGRGGGGGG